MRPVRSSESGPPESDDPGLPEGIADEVVEKVAKEAAEELALQPVDRDSDEPMPTMSEQIAEQLGGVRGMVEASIPILTFVLLNFILGSTVLDLPGRNGLYLAIGGALATAVVIGTVRLIRREPVRHAVNGVFAIALGAYLAARSGDAKDFYLPGIVLTLGQVVVLVGSVMFRKPIIGYVWAIMVNKGKHDWLHQPRLLFTFQWLTLAWAASLFVRGGTQGLLYLADQEHLLGAARIFLSWPIYAAMLVLTVWAVRRVTRQTEGAPAA